jgi:hypothetical protein
MNNKRINILFKNKNYEIDINPYDSFHHVIYDLYTNIIKKELQFYENFYYNYLIENKDYFLKIIKNSTKEDSNQIYLDPNNNIDIYNTNEIIELIIIFDPIILLNIITEYFTFYIKIILITHIIIEYVFLNLLKNYYAIEIFNKSFDLFSRFTFIILSITLILFTIISLIILYILYNKKEK